MPLSQAQPGKTRIGWIGTGVMGRWMCQHLMAKGFQATVSNRTKDKAQLLLDQGAKWADTPRQVAENSDLVFAIVGFPEDVKEVFLGKEGALAGSKPGTVLIDMTTSDPSLAIEIFDAAKAQGVHSLDAPVSGGDVGAKNAALSIMIGGDKDVVASVAPAAASRDRLLSLLGDNQTLVDYVLSEGPVREVTVELTPADTPSGFKWTIGSGPRKPITASSVADVVVVLRENSVASWILQ